MCILPPTAFRGHGGLQTTSEVTSDLKILLSDLDYLCSHVSLASKGLHEINDTQAEEEVYLPLTCMAWPQVKMVSLLVDMSKNQNAILSGFSCQICFQLNRAPGRKIRLRRRRPSPHRPPRRPPSLRDDRRRRRHRGRLGDRPRPHLLRHPERRVRRCPSE